MIHPLTTGLQRVLNVNLDFIIHFKQPLLEDNDDFGDDKDKIYTCTSTCTSTTDYANFDFSTSGNDTVGNRMWVLLPDDIRKRRIIHFDVAFWGLNDYNGENGEGWEEKQKLIENLVDVQLLSTLDANNARGKYKGENDIKKINIYQDYLKPTLETGSSKLSFEANLLRGDILSWIYKRMAGDYKAEIDAFNGSLARWDKGYDFGVSLINTINNVFTSSSSNRALIKVSGKTTLMTTSSDGDGENDSAELYELRGWKLEEGKIDKNAAKNSIFYIWKALNNMPTDETLILEETQKYNADLMALSFSVNGSEDFDDLSTIPDDGLTNDLSNQFRTQYEKFSIPELKSDSCIWDDIYYRKPLKAIKIRTLNDTDIKRKILGEAPNSDTVIYVELDLPEGLKSCFSQSGVLQLRSVIPIPSITTKKEHALLRIKSALIEMFAPFFEMNKTWFQSWSQSLSLVSFLGNNLPDFLETSKLFTEWRRSQIFYGLDTVKGDFERLQDVSSTIPAIIAAKNRAMLDVNRTKYYDATDGLTKGLLDLVIHKQSSTAVELRWNSVTGATKYKVFKNTNVERTETIEFPTNTGSKWTEIVTEFTPNGKYDEDEVVIYNSEPYKAKQNIDSATITPDVESNSNWEKKPYTVFEPHHAYTASEVIKHDKKYYKASQSIESPCTHTHQYQALNDNFYVTALDANDKVLATSNTVKVTRPA